MKSFKDMWHAAIEDTTTGSVDMIPTPLKSKSKKKKEQSLYDGRTREGKKFVERMLAKKQARESKKLEK
jgi:hypothetical protein